MYYSFYVSLNAFLMVQLPVVSDFTEYFKRGNNERALEDLALLEDQAVTVKRHAFQIHTYSSSIFFIFSLLVIGSEEME